MESAMIAVIFEGTAQEDRKEAYLDAAARRQVYEGNARRVYPRLGAVLKAREVAS